jgi:hypothetical protein
MSVPGGRAGSVLLREMNQRECRPLRVRVKVLRWRAKRGAPQKRAERVHAPALVPCRLCIPAGATSTRRLASRARSPQTGACGDWRMLRSGVLRERGIDEGIDATDQYNQRICASADLAAGRLAGCSSARWLAARLPSHMPRSSRSAAPAARWSTAAASTRWRTGPATRRRARRHATQRRRAVSDVNPSKLNSSLRHRRASLALHKQRRGVRRATSPMSQRPRCYKLRAALLASSDAAPQSPRRTAAPRRSSRQRAASRRPDTAASGSPSSIMKGDSKSKRTSCCAFLSALLLEVLAWGLAVVAITTSFWLGAPAGCAPGAGAESAMRAHADVSRRVLPAQRRRRARCPR